MRTALEMRKEAIGVVKSSLEMKRRGLEFNARQYRQRLAIFERGHHMTTRQFAKKFAAGELGDDAEWFEWEFVSDALRETEKQLELLGSVRL